MRAAMGRERHALVGESKPIGIAARQEVEVGGAPARRFLVVHPNNFRAAGFE